MLAQSAVVRLIIFAMKIDESVPPPNNNSASMSRLILTPERPEQKIKGIFGVSFI
jgi:hypothetical protein